LKEETLDRSLCELAWEGAMKVREEEPNLQQSHNTTNG